jgi:hypothetical protein
MGHFYCSGIKNDALIRRVILQTRISRYDRLIYYKTLSKGITNSYITQLVQELFIFVQTFSLHFKICIKQNQIETHIVTDVVTAVAYFISTETAFSFS